MIIQSEESKEEVNDEPKKGSLFGFGSFSAESSDAKSNSQDKSTKKQDDNQDAEEVKPKFVFKWSPVDSKDEDKGSAEAKPQAKSGSNVGGFVPKSSEDTTGEKKAMFAGKPIAWAGSGNFNFNKL